MSTELRSTGIGGLGDMPWGAHVCLYYETGADLLDAIVPYFAAGLNAGELCLWMPSEPETEEEALHQLRRAVPDLDRHLADGHLEFINADDWYRPDGHFDIAAVMRRWEAQYERVCSEGHVGLRGCGDLGWLQRKDWESFDRYECELHAFLRARRMMVLCTYPLATSRATDVFDTARTHHLAVVRRDDRWEMIETPTLKRTKEEIQRLTEELEQRVAGRTAQLRRSEAYLAEGERLSHTGSFAWDVTRREITFWSAEQFRIFGFEPRDHPPRVDEVNARLHPDDRSAWAALEETMVRERRGVDFDYRVLLPNGETRYVHAVPRPVVDDAGHVVEIIGSAIDVTERKRAAARLARTKRLSRERALQARFAAILEERTRLSREIHDTLLQGVTGIALQLRATLPHLSAAPVPVQGSIRQIVELAEKTIRDARRAVWDMRVAAVVQRGLSRALEDEVRRVAAGLELRFAIEGRPRTLPPSVEDVIFRVAAEAVANVVRHADARTVSVTLRYERRAVHLTIEDDGRGFASDPAFRANAGRWGLLGMRERAERVDASLSIRSDRGEEGAGGTTVELLVPDVRLGSLAATLRSADEPAPMRAD